jgi:hypothetical protein
MPKNFSDSPNHFLPKKNSISDLRTLSAVTLGINVGLLVTQPPVTLFSYIGARMTSRNEKFSTVFTETSQRGIPGLLRRMIVSNKRRVLTFGIPYPIITYASQKTGIESPIVPSVAATAFETIVASSPKIGSEVAERFGLVNGQAFFGIKGTLFTITKKDFESQHSKLENPDRCSKYKVLEELRTVAKQNKVFNRTALAMRNFSFFAAVGAKEVVQQKVDEGLIAPQDQSSYEMAARFSACVMSVFPDVLFTYIASGRMHAKEAIKSLPEAFIKNARTLPIIPRIVTCYLGATAANYGFDMGKAATSEDKEDLRRISNVAVKKDKIAAQLEREMSELKIDEKEIMDIAMDVFKDQIPQMVQVINDVIDQPLGWKNKSEGEFVENIVEMTAQAQKEAFESRRVDKNISPSPSPSPKEPKKARSISSAENKGPRE